VKVRKASMFAHAVDNGLIADGEHMWGGEITSFCTVRFFS